MARGREFSVIETQLIRDNIDKTLMELEDLFRKAGYDRSRKSISRKIEKMREEEGLGLRSAATISRAYRQRGKRPKKDEDDTPSLRGGPGFGGGWDSTDWGDADWGDDGSNT